MHNQFYWKFTALFKVILFWAKNRFFSLWMKSHSELRNRVFSVASRVILFVFLFSVFWRPAGSITAQDSEATIPLPPEMPRFNYLTSEDGLAHNHVSATIQDRHGFMWFGTLDGLNRYDGYHFTRYRHDENIPTSLSSNNISAIVEDPDGLIWVATEDGGLNRVDPTFDPEAGKVVRYQHDPGNTNSLSDNHLESLAIDQDGILWIGTGAGGLDRFDPDTETFTRYRPPSVRPDVTPIEAILVDATGEVWVGGEVLYRFNPGNGRFTTYPVAAPPPRPPGGGEGPAPGEGPPGGGPPPDGGPPPGGSPPPAGGPPLSFGVNALYEDANGRLWVGSNYLYLFDRQTGRFTPYSPEPPVPITGILADGAGRLWLGTGRGVYIFDPQTEQFLRHYEGNPSDSNHFTGRFVTSLYRSSEELIWIGTTSGLNIYDWRQASFTAYLPGTPPDGLGNPNVHAVIIGPAGDLWAAGGPELSRIDRATGQVTAYQAPIQFAPNTDQLLISISAMHFDSEGFLWMDSLNELLRLNPATEEFQSVPLDDPDAGEIIEMRADPDGILWLLTARVLYRFDPETGQLTSFGQEPGNPAGFPDRTVTTLRVDESGIVWVGGPGLLSRFDPQTEQFHHYTHNPQNLESLTNGQPTAVHQAADGIIWIATESGLNRLDPQTQTFTRYTESDGLPSDALFGLLADEQGRLWLSSFRGLSRFDPVTETFRNFGLADGLPVSNFISGAYFLGPGGEMFFGGRGGLVTFFPQEINENSYRPPVVLTQLRLANEPVFVGSSDGVLSTSIWSTADLTLDYDQDIVSFDFAALSYAASQENRYRYRLEGLEEEWNEVDSSGRSARYTTLLAGRYVFRVQGTNNDGLWSDQEAALHITVRPPWWETLWFRGAALLLLAGIVFGSFRWRVYTIQRRNQELEREVAARTQELAESNEQLQTAKEAAEIASQAKSTFLSSMSHELRTPLNGILGYAQILRRDHNVTSTQADGLQVIYESGQHLLTLINDVLDLAKVEAGKIELAPADFHLGAFLEGIVAVARMSAQQKDIRFIYEAGPNLPAGVQADEKRLRQVLLNLAGNAVKFTDSGQVTLRVTNQTADSGRAPEARLRFEIEDTGVGMAADQLEKIFLPFEQVGDKRKRTAGTGLGLPISQQLVALMGGNIEVSSVPGQGSRFWFEISLPAAVAARQEEQSSAGIIRGYAGQRRRVLVADDRRENRLVLLNMLEPLGFEVTLATNGREALELAQETRPDLILLDLVMPVMTGFEAVQQLRQLPEQAETPIIAISASVFAMDQAKSRLAGCDAFLPKPVEAGRLLALCEKFLGLTWIHEALDAADILPETAKPDGPLITPPQEELEILYELAMLGKMTQIRERVDRLEEMNSRFTPFVYRVRELADAFEDQRIANFIKELINDENFLEGSSHVGAG
jgi:signal transduction histidine kinase/streptogramin lyase/CheY-like chemotaxis protein